MLINQSHCLILTWKCQMRIFSSSTMSEMFIEIYYVDPLRKTIQLYLPKIKWLFLIVFFFFVSLSNFIVFFESNSTRKKKHYRWYYLCTDCKVIDTLTITLFTVIIIIIDKNPAIIQQYLTAFSYYFVAKLQKKIRYVSYADQSIHTYRRWHTIDLYSCVSLNVKKKLFSCLKQWPIVKLVFYLNLFKHFL